MVKGLKVQFWLTTFSVSLLVILISVFLTPLTSISFLYLVYLLLIIAVTVVGGFLGGIIVTAISVLTRFNVLFFSGLSVNEVTISWLETVFFVITAFSTSFLIDKYRKTDIVAGYKVKLEKYKKKLIKLESEKTKMQQEVRQRDEFLSIASHELKTPLTTMLMKIQILLHNIRNVSLANFSVQNLLDMLETAEEQTKRLSQMINDLLNVSLITTGKYTLAPKKEDISIIVKDVVKEFSEKLKNSKYSLAIDADKPAEVFVDRLRISQVLTNLLSNSIKYGEGKPIKVAVKRKNGFVAISVKDNGLGIDENYQERIFNLFERGEADKNIKGLGVGLYISNQIVKAHGGRIKVDSKLNHGSVFTVELPAKNV